MIDPRTYASLGELLSDALIQFKRHEALIEIDRSTERHRWTYLDVRRQVAAVVAWLEGLGVGPDEKVAIVMSNQSRWLVGACAVLHRGAVIVPIDYKLSEGEQRALIEHAGARTLLTEHGLLRRFTTAPVPVERTLVEGADGATVAGAQAWDALPERDAPLGPPAPRTRDDVACLVYSSGTGGRPKGCLLHHGAYLSQLGALMALYPLRPGHVVFSVLPTNHAIDFMVGFVGPFSCGAAVVHQRTLRPEFLLSTMQREGVTHMALVPSLLGGMVRAIDDRIAKRPAWQSSAVEALGGLNALLVARAPSPAISRRLLAPIHDALGGRLELLFCGGAFVEERVAEKLYRWGLPVAIGYGLTECCTVATVNDLRPFRADTVGRAVEGVRIAIGDPDDDGVGEVRIAGPTVMKGYHRDPELSAEAIDAAGWLHTGDLGWIDASGHLHLVGRRKNMIVTAGGKNVYPEDIESAFAEVGEELAILASGYVWPRAQHLTDEVLVAVVRAKGDHAPVLETIHKRNRRLPEHKRVGAVLFVDDPFPRTASLKVKRHELRDRIAHAHGPGDPIVLHRAARTEAVS